MASVNDLIADGQVSHSIGLQRLGTSTTRKVIALLEKAIVRISERLLSDELTDLGRRRQEKLLRDLQGIIDSAYTDITGQLRLDLEGLAKYEGEYQLDLINRSVGVDLGFTMPSEDQLVAVVNSRPFQGRLLKEWGQDLSATTFRRVRDAVRLGIVEQRTTAEIIRELRGTRKQGFKDGLLQIDKRHAEAVVRTAVNHTATAARERLYSRNKKLIKGQQVLATLDSRTSNICMAADGRVATGEGYSKSDFPKKTRYLADMPNLTNESRPPFHINCRSVMTPILRSLTEMGLKEVKGTRASIDGQVPADLTYEEWLRKKPAKFQDEVLGKAKGKLFRQGDVSLDRFVARDGDEMTLDELKVSERSAWNKVFA
jgi:hypothetical protein